MDERERRVDWSLVEQNATERALSKLGLSPDVHPSEIPGVNIVFNLCLAEPSMVNFIEIADMPGAGKDTVLGKAKGLLGDKFDFIEEQYSILKELFKQPFASQQPTWAELRKLLSNMLAFETGKKLGELLQRGEDNNIHYVIQNRGETDELVWAKAQFLAGHLHIEEYRNLVRSWETDRLELASATFIFMIKPETSLVRRGEEAPGRIMNERFLRILYTQYLRLISELREKNSKNVVVLDTSGSPENNLEVFIKILKKITGGN